MVSQSGGNLPVRAYLRQIRALLVPGYERAGRFPGWLGFALLLAATVLAHLPAIKAGFIWNDEDYVTAPALRTLRGLWRIWFEVGATQQYYPALHSAFWLEHLLWGEWAPGYHLVNILTHGASAWVFCLILRRLSVPGAWLAGLLFALHPVCVESIAWISEQKNTLSTVFYLLSALVYLRFDEGNRAASDGPRGNRILGGRPGPYFLALGLFLAALLSKSMAATLPAALLVVLWWKRGSLSWRRDVLPLVPWLILGAAVGLFTGWVERTYIGAQGRDFTFSPVERVLIAGRAIWFYFGKLVWPAHLVFIYPRWQIDARAWWQYLFPAGAVGFTALLWSLRGRLRGPLAAWLFFVGSLFPILGFLNVYAFVFSFVADHWQYLASLGVITAAAGAWGRWRASVGPAARAVPLVCACAVAGALGVLSWRECSNYHDVEGFYRTILSRNPACWMAHNNLGFALQAFGRTAEARSHYEAALKLRRDYPEAHSNLGAALYETGHVDEAIAHYREAIRLFDNYAEARDNLGIALDATGHLPEAIAEFQRVIALRPGSAEAHGNLGISLAKANRIPEAVEQYEAALALKPGLPTIVFNLGVAEAQLGDRARAITAYEKAIKLTPDYPAVHNNLGNVFVDAGRIADAVAEYNSALKINPAYADAHNNLGQTFNRLGRKAEAAKEFQLAVDEEPKNAMFHFNLGNALAAVGNTSGALAEFQQVVRLDPGYPDGHNNLGALYCLVGRNPEAISEISEALRLRPDYADAHRNLGVAFQNAKRREEAAAQFEIASRLTSGAAKSR